MNDRAWVIANLVTFPTEALVEMETALNHDIRRNHPEKDRLVQLRYILADVIRARKEPA